MGTEAGVGIPLVFDLLPVLLPEKEQGNALMALEFPVNRVPVRLDPNGLGG
jgi:hypothetical protein